MKIGRIVLLVLLVIATNAVFAQCPMCKMAAETNMQNGGNAGRGLNTGILYMLAMPYLLVGVLGFLWYKNRHKIKE
jgi:hypothetical protein